MPAATRAKEGAAEAVAPSSRAAALDALYHLADLISGRTFSPRIKLLSIEQVTQATGQAQSTIYEMVQDGRFPKPKKVGRKNMWRESTIIAWLDDLPDNDCVRDQANG